MVLKIFFMSREPVTLRIDEGESKEGEKEEK